MSETAQISHEVKPTGRIAFTIDTALLLLRVVPFGLLTVHGAQKLFGVWGGKGLSGTASGFAAMGYEPAWFFALLGGGAEFVGGILLFLGLFTPLGAAMSLGVMINAVAAVAAKGLESSGYAIVLAVIAAALAISGPGRFSLDAGRPWHRTGPVVAAVSIAVAVATSAATLLVKG
ncbi:DoxX family protein [Saccharopolyspora sp. WRP15-2]|uniref:DoxX family protein n=1 Tax=Saccharopolyspora oryzae TaxID=2997343 RepID=A0ABT4UQI7_9PSEU|nr:DoxX family protein [Saccharopolyspora oryzae]MDA3623992.1 DoxX family protein [Saccharopolyspora oryzae]